MINTNINTNSKKHIYNSHYHNDNERNNIFVEELNTVINPIKKINNNNYNNDKDRNN
jgi:hypothetical protein